MGALGVALCSCSGNQNSMRILRLHPSTLHASTRLQRVSMQDRVRARAKLLSMATLLMPHLCKTSRCLRDRPVFKLLVMLYVLRPGEHRIVPLFRFHSLELPVVAPEGCRDARCLVRYLCIGQLLLQECHLQQEKPAGSGTASPDGG